MLSSRVSKIAVAGDTHIGNFRQFGGETIAGINRRGQLCLDVLQDALDLAVTHECTDFVIVGDVFDSDRPSLQLVAATTKLFLLAIAEGLTVHLLVGNHDQRSELLGDHSMATMMCVHPQLRVHEKPTVVESHGVRLGFIPFSRSNQARMFNEAEPCDVLFIHCGVSDERTAPWLLESPDHIDAESAELLRLRLGAQAVFAGNWHDRRQWGWIQQVGALMQTNFGAAATSALEIFAGGTLVNKALPTPIAFRANVGGSPIGERDLNSRTFIKLYAGSQKSLRQCEDELVEWKRDGKICDGEAVLELVKQEPPPKIAVLGESRDGMKTLREYIKQQHPKDAQDIWERVKEAIKHG